MATRPESESDTVKADAEWLAEIERRAATGSLRNIPPVSKQLAVHFARLGITDATT